MTNTPKFWGAFLYIYIMGSKDTHTDTDDNRLTAELYIDEKSRTLILKIRDFRDDVSAVVAARAGGGERPGGRPGRLVGAF